MNLTVTNTGLVGPMESGQAKNQLAKVSSFEYVSFDSDNLLFVCYLLFFLFFSAVDCGPLRNPVNGRVTFTSTKFRSSATYTCDSGLVLFGKGIRACQANGRWEGRNPECKGLLKVV